MSGDWEASFGFYSELFGWVKQDAMDMGEGNMYQMYSRPGSFPLGGMYNKPAFWQGPPASWLLYISVDDMKTAVEKLPALGGTLLNGPMEVPVTDASYIEASSTICQWPPLRRRTTSVRPLTGSASG